MKNNNGTIVTAVVAMLCITALAAIALANGVDGAMFMSAIAIIGGLGGYAVGIKQRKGNDKTPKSDKPAT